MSPLFTPGSGLRFAQRGGPTQLPKDLSFPRCQCFTRRHFLIRTGVVDYGGTTSGLAVPDKRPKCLYGTPTFVHHTRLPWELESV